MRWTIYARISKEEKTRQQYSIPMQIDECTKFVRWNDPDAIIQGVYVDEDYTAAHTNRPDFKKVLKVMDKGETDVLLVWRIDRLSRSLLDAITLVKEWERKSILLKSVTQPFDLSTPYGRQNFYNLAAYAEWERSSISERVENGMKRKAKDGKTPGGKPAYGYKMEEGYLFPVPEEAKVVRLVFDMYLGGYGYDRITAYLNSHLIPTKYNAKWTPMQIKRILKNPVYVGKVIYGVRKYDYVNGKQTLIKYRADYVEATGIHEPIIDPVTFEKAQKIMADRSTGKAKARTKNETHLLTGLIKCHCGGKMYAYRIHNGNYLYYHCQNVVHHPHICQEKLIKKDLIDEPVYEVLQREISETLLQHLDLETTEVPATPVENQRAILETQLKEIEFMKENLLNALARGIISDEEFIPQRTKLNNSKESILAELSNISKTASETDSFEIEEKVELMTKLKNFLKKPLQALSGQEIILFRELIAACTESIQIIDDAIQISFLKPYQWAIP